jgi:predicted DNA-binding transcriptional regulator AlpA
MTERVLELLQAVRQAAAEAQAAGKLPIFLGELERVRVEIVFSAINSLEPLSAGPKKDRLLSAAEVAQRIGRSKWWIYENKDSLPIVRLQTGRYGFSEKALDRWMKRRASA